MLNSGVIVNRYANALIASVPDTKELKLVIAELEKVMKSVNSSEEFSKLIFNKVVPSRLKLKLVNLLINKEKVSETVQKTLMLLVKNNRVFLLKELQGELVSRMQKKEGLTLVRFETAREITEGAKKQITESLEKALSKKLIVRFVVNHRVIGGFKVYYESQMLDRSICSKLAAIEKQLRNNDFVAVQDSKSMMLNKK